MTREGSPAPGFSWRKCMGIEPTSRAVTARDNGFEVWPMAVRARHAASANVNVISHLLHSAHAPHRTNTRLSVARCARIVPQNSCGAAGWRPANRRAAAAGEALRVRWPAIDLDARIWHLPALKAGPRSVYLDRPAVELLRALPHADERVEER
jgi:integrase